MVTESLKDIARKNVKFPKLNESENPPLKIYSTVKAVLRGKWMYPT